MDQEYVLKYLRKKLNFSEISIKKLHIFSQYLIKFNSKYNLIAKSTEKTLWTRHILDSAQIIKFIENKKDLKIIDFGSGAGFPGIIVSIFDLKNTFHVKLFEKSPVKRFFLEKIIEKLDLNCKIGNDIYQSDLYCDLIICRAFKKLDEILKISREMIDKPHKLIILKGKDAEKEINNVSLDKNYSYKIEKSITNKDSKILLIEVK